MQPAVLKLLSKYSSSCEIRQSHQPQAILPDLQLHETTNSSSLVCVGYVQRQNEILFLKSLNQPEKIRTYADMSGRKVTSHSSGEPSDEDHVYIRDGEFEEAIVAVLANHNIYLGSSALSR